MNANVQIAVGNATGVVGNADAAAGACAPAVTMTVAGAAEQTAPPAAAAVSQHSSASIRAYEHLSSHLQYREIRR